MPDRINAIARQSQRTSVLVSVRGLTMAYGDFVLMRDLTFEVKRGDIFFIMGGSGCGKSTLLYHLIGLKEPVSGEISYDGLSFTKADPDQRQQMLRLFGILYQQSALWSSMTLAENVTIVIRLFTNLTPAQAREVACMKLALVGLKGFEDYYPNQISGGMKKRAGLARAIALDPELLFFDEPSAGLDPVTSHLLDELIVDLKESLGATIVIVSHELASIFGIGTNSIFLDADSHSAIARGHPKQLLAHTRDPRVLRFLTRGIGEAREVTCHE